MTDKAKIDSLSPEAKGWLHRTVVSMNDVGEYMDNPKLRKECIEAGVVSQLRSKCLEVSADINAIVYTEGYLAAFA